MGNWCQNSWGNNTIPKSCLRFFFTLLELMIFTKLQVIDHFFSFGSDKLVFHLMTMHLINLRCQVNKHTQRLQWHIFNGIVSLHCNDYTYTRYPVLKKVAHLTKSVVVLYCIHFCVLYLSTLSDRQYFFLLNNDIQLSYCHIFKMDDLISGKFYK